MLAKKNRISRSLLKSSGAKEAKPKFSSTKNFSLRMLPSPDEEPHVSVSVSKKIAKSAVVRNRIRRRTYSFARDFLPKLKNNLYMISAKANSSEVSAEELRREIGELLI